MDTNKAQQDYVWAHLGKVPGSLGISGNLRPLSEECLGIFDMWVLTHFFDLYLGL